MTRETLHAAARHAMAASDTMILAAAYEGRDTDKQQRLRIEAEAALYAALDLIWASAEPARDRFTRMAAEIASAPYQTQEAA